MSQVDVLGIALMDFYKGLSDPLYIHNKYGEPEIMPVEAYFREIEDLTDLEKIMIAQCEGNILDIGAGAGALSLILQENHHVTALEISEGACNVMRLHGVQNGIIGDVYDYNGSGYDTILLAMNGIGIVGTLDRLVASLEHFASMLNKTGQILLDSSDISYLYEDSAKPTDRYYGEIEYQYGYKNFRSNWFEWLYVDYDTLSVHAEKAGLQVEKLYEDEYQQYLVSLKTS